MGFPRFPGRSRPRVSALPAAHAGGGDGSDRGAGQGRRVCGSRRPKALSRCGPTSWSAPMAGAPSCARRRALRSMDLGAPMDVLWMRVSKRPGDPSQLLGRIEAGQMLVMIDRGDYWQCAYRHPQGLAGATQAGGACRPFARSSRELAPFLGDRVDELAILGRHQAAHRCGRSAQAMVQARAAVHRRCGPRHVARRRRRDQSRDPGCGRDGQYPRARC